MNQGGGKLERQGLEGFSHVASWEWSGRLTNDLLRRCPLEIPVVPTPSSIVCFPVSPYQRNDGKAVDHLTAPCSYPSQQASVNMEWLEGLSRLRRMNGPTRLTGMRSPPLARCALGSATPDGTRHWLCHRLATIKEILVEGGRILFPLLPTTTFPAAIRAHRLQTLLLFPKAPHPPSDNAPISRSHP